jgi:hypothetical protein
MPQDKRKIKPVDEIAVQLINTDPQNQREFDDGRIPDAHKARSKDKEDQDQPDQNQPEQALERLSFKNRPALDTTPAGLKEQTIPVNFKSRIVITAGKTTFGPHNLTHPVTPTTAMYYLTSRTCVEHVN